MSKKEQWMVWYENNRTKRDKYVKEYSKSPMGKAHNQCGNYKRMDIRNGFGEVIDFDARWIVENIYTKKCAHCGETDWRKLGCNRLDNSKPHTKDNVEPCCQRCNCKLRGADTQKEQSKAVYQYDKLTNKFIKKWINAHEASKHGYTQTSISSCCNGKRKSHKGCIWSFKEL